MHCLKQELAITSFHLNNCEGAHELGLCLK